MRHVAGHPHPAAVVPAPDSLDHDRAPDAAGELVDVVQGIDGLYGGVARHRGAERFEPSPHDEFVLGVHQRLGRRRHVNAFGDQLVEQLRGDMLMIEGQRVRPGGNAAQVLEIGVRADHHVRGDLGGGVVGVGGQDPQRLTESDGSLVRHSGKLTAADHGDQRRYGRGTGHANNGVMALTGRFNGSDRIA
jgi:hypothetical protein